jgi:hypothetical protein
VVGHLNFQYHFRDLASRSIFCSTPVLAHVEMMHRSLKQTYESSNCVVSYISLILRGGRAFGVRHQLVLSDVGCGMHSATYTL